MGSRYALIVATDRYSDVGLRELAAPAHDAEALASVLGDTGIGDFDVQVVSNRSAQDVRVAVEDFFADRDRSDTLLLHFSGHGLKNAAGELFLAAADTRPGRLASTGVGSDFLSRQMADSRAERIVLLLDCCYGGAFPRGMVVRAGGEAEVMEAFAAQSDVAGGKGRAVVTASSAMEYSFEEGNLTAGSPGSPSVFTSALVDALASGEADTDGDGWVGLHELFEYVSSAVRTTNPHQTPHMWTFGSQGELLIARSKVRRIRPTPLSGELTEALASPLAATRYGVVDLLRQRLTGADLGHAATALDVLSQLVDDDSRRVAEAAATAVADAVVRASPSPVVLDADESGTAATDVTLSGPPLALAATVTTDDPRIRAVYTEPTVEIVVSSREPVRGTVRIESQTGTVAVPVELRVTAPTAVVVPPPPPVRTPPPSPEEPKEAPVAATRSRRRNLGRLSLGRLSPGQLSRSRAGSWVVGGLLVVGALVLLSQNIPGDYQELKGFYAPQFEWYAYRASDDPWVLTSVVCVVAAVLSLCTRGRRQAWALGVLLGGCLYLIGEGITYLVLGYADDEGVTNWRVTVVVSAAIIALSVVLIRPRFSPPVRPGLVPLGMLAVGAGLVIGNRLVPYADATSLDVFGGMPLLFIAIQLAVAVLALCSPDVRTREALGFTAATWQLVNLYDTLGWRHADALGPHLALMLPATVLIVGAIVIGLMRPPAEAGVRAP